MSTNGFAIDSHRHPVGYITDFPFSTVHSSTGNAIREITVKIGNLPMAATVVFNLEEINLSTSIDTFFTIRAMSATQVRQEYYKTVVSVVNQTAEIHGSQTLVVEYQSNLIANVEGYVCVKYKGRSIETVLLEIEAGCELLHS